MTRDLDKLIERLRELRQRALDCKGTPGEKEAAFDYGSEALVALPILLDSLSASAAREKKMREVLANILATADPAHVPTGWRDTIEAAANAAMKAGVAFMDSSPVSDPEGTLVAAVQAIRSLPPPPSADERG